jgi:hypothetical protein
MGDEPVALRAGRERLSSASGELDEGPSPVLRHRDFEGRYRVDLAFAQSVRDDRPHLAQATAKRESLAQRTLQRLGRWTAKTLREAGFGSAWSRKRVSLPDATYSNCTYPSSRTKLRGRSAM